MNKISNGCGVPLQFSPENEHLTRAEKEDGWITSKLSDGTRVKKKVLFHLLQAKKHNDSQYAGAHVHSAISQGWPIFIDQKLTPDDRDNKLTWEVITDNSVHSYNIEQVGLLHGQRSPLVQYKYAHTHVPVPYSRCLDIVI